MRSSSLATTAGTVVAPGQAVGRRARRRDGGAQVSEEAVLAEVRRLCDVAEAPSTTVVVAALVGDGRVAPASLHAAVRDVLERLRDRAELECVSGRGTHRWQPPA